MLFGGSNLVGLILLKVIQIILNSGYQFQGRFKKTCLQKKTPGGHAFWRIKIQSSYFCRGSSRKHIPVMFGWNWPCGIGGLVIWSKLLMMVEARWTLTDPNSLITSCSVHFWEFFAPSTHRTIRRACSTVGNVSDCRYMPDCSSRGKESDPGPDSYFRGDWS